MDNENKIENEIRYYLKQIKKAMEDPDKPFMPQYIITAILRPPGVIELSVNSADIAGAIDNILDGFDEDMHLVGNYDIIMQNVMIV